MQPIIQFFRDHPYAASVVSTWFFNNIVTAFVGSFPAPTKDSTAKYVWWFKFSNTVIGNLKRAKSTALENSPNWQDAIDRHTAQNGNGSQDSK